MPKFKIHVVIHADIEVEAETEAKAFQWLDHDSGLIGEQTHLAGMRLDIADWIFDPAFYNVGSDEFQAYEHISEDEYL